MEKKGLQPEIRRLTPGDMEESVRLSEYAFQLEWTEQEREEQKRRFVPEWMWGAFVDGRLAAQLIQYPLQVYIQGKKMDASGIGHVSSWPETRRSGLVAGLIARSLRDMREKGQAVSLLTPFSCAFYRKYGWEMAIDFKKYTIPARMWPVSAKENVPGSYRRLTGETKAIVEMLGPVYEQYAARYNGALSRTADWWDKRVIRARGGEFVAYRDETGAVQGYLHYRAKNREFTVHEFVALTPQAELALWRFIAQHDSMAERAVLRMPMDDGLSLLCAEPRFGQEIVHYFMARIVDMETFLAQYAFAPLENRPRRWTEGKEAVFTLEVDDAHGEWNNGRFAVAVDDAGRAEVTRASAHGAAGPLVRGTIQAFSALFIGARRAEQLRRYGKLAGSDEAVGLLDALVNARTPFLCDHF